MRQTPFSSLKFDKVYFGRTHPRYAPHPAFTTLPRASNRGGEGGTPVSIPLAVDTFVVSVSAQKRCKLYVNQCCGHESNSASVARVWRYKNLIITIITITNMFLTGKDAEIMKC